MNKNFRYKEAIDKILADSLEKVEVILHLVLLKMWNAFVKTKI